MALEACPLGNEYLSTRTSGMMDTFFEFCVGRRRLKQNLSIPTLNASTSSASNENQMFVYLFGLT